MILVPSCAKLCDKLCLQVPKVPRRSAEQELRQAVSSLYNTP